MSHPLFMMGGMTDQHAHQQLTLLPPADVPVQFRIDEATRRRGMRHIAEIRAMLESRKADGPQDSERNAA